MSGVESFVPAVWEAALLTGLAKAAVFTQPNVVNRNYEEDLKSSGGRSVTVNRVGAVSVKKHESGSDIETEDLTAEATKLEMDQERYYSFRIKDVEAVQAAGPLKDPAIKKAVAAMRDEQDKHVAALWKTKTLKASQIGATKVFVGERSEAKGHFIAWDILGMLAEKLDNQQVPADDRFVVIDGTFKRALSLDRRFSEVHSAGSDETLRNGYIGRANGFDILVSQNLPQSTGKKPIICAGTPDAVSFATQLESMQALVDPKRFAVNVRGLTVFGAEAFMPECMASVEIDYVLPKPVEL